jgi:glucokinase
VTGLPEMGGAVGGLSDNVVGADARTAASGTVEAPRPTPSDSREHDDDVVPGVVLGIDIGGTKIAVGLVDEQGRVLAQHRLATPHGVTADAETLLRAVLAAVAELPKPPDGYLGVGIGCGGPMRWPSGEVSPLNIHGWRDFPLRARLREVYPDLPVRLHNDAVCAAAAEHWLGAGRGSANMLGMVVSTGVGGGLILGGRVIDGKTGNAGHIGHMVVDPYDPPCVCGGIGCLEAIASGPRLAAWAVAQGWREGLPDDERTGRDLSADASRGHPVALAAMERAGRAIGIAVASAVVTCDLEVVAIGGGLSQAGPMLFDPMHETIRRYIGMDFAKDAKVVPVELGQLAGIVGAAALVHRGDIYWSAD